MTSTKHENDNAQRLRLSFSVPVLPVQGQHFDPDPDPDPDVRRGSSASRSSSSSRAWTYTPMRSSTRLGREPLELQAPTECQGAYVATVRAHNRLQEAQLRLSAASGCGR
jgi:hypothetical protein